MNTGKNTKYLGWTNRETWNVMLWINNTYELYKSVVYILEETSYIPTYTEVINRLDLNESTTGDGVAYINNTLNYQELNDAIISIKESI